MALLFERRSDLISDLAPPVFRLLSLALDRYPGSNDCSLYDANGWMTPSLPILATGQDFRAAPARHFVTRCSLSPHGLLELSSAVANRHSVDDWLRKEALRPSNVRSRRNELSRRPL